MSSSFELRRGAKYVSKFCLRKNLMYLPGLHRETTSNLYILDCFESCSLARSMIDAPIQKILRPERWAIHHRVVLRDADIGGGDFGGVNVGAKIFKKIDEKQLFNVIWHPV